MSTMGPKSQWLNPPTDEQMIEKAARGFSSIIAGAPLVQRLAKAVEAVAVCKSGHEEMVGKIRDLKKCRCSAPWVAVKGEQIEPEAEEGTATYRRMVKADDQIMVPTGGLTDGQPTMTSKSKVRAPFTGSR